MELLSTVWYSFLEGLWWFVQTAAFKWIFLILVLVMPLASLLTWAERRQSAMMQDRRGPNRANIGPFKLWGIAHFIADAFKMIGKEDFVPAGAHRGLFTLAPILALAPVLIAFAIIPFGPDIYVHDLLAGYPNASWNIVGRTAADFGIATEPVVLKMQVFEADFGLLFYFAVLTVANYGATIAGWASYNKYALLGGLRSSSQMMSYEVSMGLSLIGVFLVMRTLEPGAMVLWQGANPGHWGVVVQPLAFLLFFTAAIAETKRAPFDIPEGEPEIIGYFVEYSGIRWGMFFLAEFIEIVFIAAIITTVFFGGWQVPFLYEGMLPHWLTVLLQFAAFGAKVVLFCFLQLAIRWTLPRFRPDQLMHIGWKWLLPLSLVNIIITAIITTFI